MLRLVFERVFDCFFVHRFFLKKIANGHTYGHRFWDFHGFWEAEDETSGAFLLVAYIILYSF